MIEEASMLGRAFRIDSSQLWGYSYVEIAFVLLDVDFITQKSWKRILKEAKSQDLTLCKLNSLLNVNIFERKSPGLQVRDISIFSSCVFKIVII